MIKPLPKTPTLPSDLSGGGKSFIRAMWDHINQSNQAVNKLIAKAPRLDIGSGKSQGFAYNSTPNLGTWVDVKDGDDANPTLKGTIPSVYIQRVDASVTSDDAAHLIAAQYTAFKRLPLGRGWIYGHLVHVEDQSNSGTAQSVAVAGMITAKDNAKVWGIYGDALRITGNATITGGEFDSNNLSGVNATYDPANPIAQPFCAGVWIAAAGNAFSTFGLGIGGAGQSFYTGITFPVNGVVDYGIHMVARPFYGIQLANGAQWIGIDTGASAAYGTGDNDCAIHLHSHKLGVGNGGFIRYNPATTSIEIGVKSGGVETIIRSIDMTSAYAAL
jgi:hypothetical protein